jgi:nicotinamidase-related amidase
MVEPAFLTIDMQEALVSGAYDEQRVVARIGTVARRMAAAELPIVFVTASEVQVS